VIAPRLRKVVADLAVQPSRTLLAVLAMAAGAFGLAMILTAYAVLARELKTNFATTRPAAAILHFAAPGDSLVALARGAPDVLDAEARHVVRGRARVGPDTWLPLVLYVVPDFDHVRIDTFRPVAGAWPPADDAVLLERSALGIAHVRVGGALVVRPTGGPEQTLRVEGAVHAPGLAPAFMDHVVTGFVSARSPLVTGAATPAWAVRIRVRERPLDEAHIRAVAAGVAALYAARGVTVTRIEVPPPGRHPHADQMDTFLFLLGGFAGLTLVAASVLVAALMDALLARQVREIGILKSIGATDGQVAALYLVQVLALALAGLVPGWFLGRAAGIAYAGFSASMLNLELASTAVPAWAVALAWGAGLAGPLLAALGPVRRAARLTVRDALADDAAPPAFGAHGFEGWLARRGGLSPSLRFALRSAFRRRARLVTSVALIAVGGAIFVSALDVAAAWTRALSGERRAHRYDVDAHLARPIAESTLVSALAGAPLVRRAEPWGEVAADLAAGDARVLVSGVPAASQALALPLLAGRQLAHGDTAGAVVNQALVARVPHFAVGDRLALAIDGRPVAWRVVGVVQELMPVPIAYVPRAALDGALAPSSRGSGALRVTAVGSSPPAVDAATRQLEQALARAGVEVTQTQSVAERIQALADHLVIVRSALLLAAALVLFVAALGLASTLGVSVLERTREIGILAAIGASPRVIASHVLVEGGLVAALGWLAAIPLAVPVTWLFDRVTGEIFFRAPLDFYLSPVALAAWLATATFLAALGSLVPALGAARLTVREALAHA
jgi:putative ABC transport system permease protein